ncbi:MAG: T9SS type A sorting domain-containing protein, partial [Bacteroidota bacterium]
LNPTHQYTTNGFKIVCAVLNPSPLPGCKDTVCTFVNVVGVGIDEFSFENSINISPNPFSDKLNIDFELNKPSDYFISVTDLNGREVIKSEIKKSATGHQHNSINTINFESGMYFICVHTDGKIIRRRIIKQ